jgi:sigma-B regulation protein RsbU (phosphoserine phosphatase)
MRHLYNDLPCIYFSSSADGFIVEANEALCHYLGYTNGELIGQKLEQIFTLSTRIFQQTHFYPLLQLNGLAEEIYITLKRKDGENLPVLINAARKEKDGQMRDHYAGISVIKRKKFEDEIITSKKEAEKALKENTTLKAAREELQKHAEELDIQIALTNLQNQELRQFNHLATHTLQEPLRKLLFFSSQILESQEEKQMRNAAQKIRKATEDLHAKLKGLQQYVWLTNEKLKCGEVDLLQEAQLTKKQVEFENSGISIILEVEAIPAIEANIDQMRFLLKELFSNAVRFRKPGNVVNVKISASTLLLNKFRELTGKYKYAEFVKIEFEDDGIGFDDKYQEQAFEFFRKLHPTSFIGVGIGLSLCKKIIENHNGSISLESQKEAGTTAIIYLPLKQQKTDC